MVNHLQKILLIFVLHKVSSLPLSQLNDLDGPLPDELSKGLKNMKDTFKTLINLLDDDYTTTPPLEIILPTFPNIDYDEDNGENFEETTYGTDKPLRIGLSIETTTSDGLNTTEENENISTEEISTVETSTNDEVGELEKSEKLEVQPKIEETKTPDTTTVKLDVEEETIKIGFKKNFVVDDLKTTVSTVRNVEVVTEEIISKEKNDKLEERFGKNIDVIEPQSKESEEPEINTEKLPQGLQPAVYNGVFAIGRSEFAPESSTQKTPKPGSFGSTFLNLAKQYDSRYKYKYSWSFSGVEKTTPKPKEADGPLFNEKFLKKLSESYENIGITTINEGETGREVNLYKPSVGSYL